MRVLLKQARTRQIFEGSVCHAKEFGFYSGDIEGPFKETTYRMNWYAKTEKRDP